MRSQTTAAASIGAEESSDGSREWPLLPRDNREASSSKIQSRKGQTHFIWSHHDGDNEEALKRKIWQELSSAPKFSAFDVATQHFIRNIKAFLEGEHQIASFQSCSTFESLLPEIASYFGLDFWKTPEGHPYHNHKSSHSLHLVKTTRTLGTEDADLLALPDLVQKHVFGRAFDVLVEDVRASCDVNYEQLLLDHQAKLLSTACQDNMEALPVITLHKPQSLPYRESGRDLWNEFPLQLALSNTQHSVCVSKTVHSRMQMKECLRNSLLDYCKAIHVITKHQSQDHLSFAGKEWHPSEFLSRASRLLGWGAIDFAEYKLLTIDLKNPGKYDLWQVSIKIASSAWDKTEVVWFGQKSTKSLALIYACVTMKTHLEKALKSGNISPGEYWEFAQYWTTNLDGKRASDLETKSMVTDVRNSLLIETPVLNIMLAALRDLRNYSFENLPSSKLTTDALETTPTSLHKWHRPMHTGNAIFAQQQFSQVKSSNTRNALPVSQPPFRTRIMNAIATNDIVIVKGATGSGKTTQIPQMVLDEFIDTGKKEFRNIVCTQPRRVSTVSVAHRVAEERGQDLQHEVGYQVRFDDRSPQAPSGITYMTSGYLLRILEQEPEETCLRFSHIILDEVHERDIDTDLIITALKNLMTSKWPRLLRFPKIILMSATIESKFFVEYFQTKHSGIKIVSLDVPGKMYPVQSTLIDEIWPELQSLYPSQTKTLLKDQKFRAYVTEQMAVTTATDVPAKMPEPEVEKPPIVQGDDAEEESQIAQNDLRSLYVPVPVLPLLLDHLISGSTAGDILVFLPGLAEIEELELRLIDGEAPHVKFATDSRFKIFKLHSSLYETNYEVWKPVSPGCRRVVLATNIAETSITLPDVRYVIDTGHARRNQYDQTTQAGNLGIAWISKAESAQRKGRAGRTQPGAYFATFSNVQYNSMPTEASPEMLRTALDQIVLRVEASKAFKLSSASTENEESRTGDALAFAPSVPDPANIEAAVQQLQNLHAITKDHKITAMGKALANLPLPPAVAKSILLGIIFRCMDPLLVVGTVRDDYPLMSHPEKPSVVVAIRRDLAAGSCDDRIADTRAFFAFDEASLKIQLDKIEELKQLYFVRRDAFLEMVRTCCQTYNVLAKATDHISKQVDERINSQPPTQISFPHSSKLLNVNSHNHDLVKALCLSTSGQRVLVWHNKNWRNPAYAKVLPAPRSVNHAGSRRDLLLQRLRRETGDILYYTSLRIIPTDKYPWACETSTVSPLVGMLFAESLRLTDENVLVINDWAQYEVILDDSSPVNSSVAAKIILEYRKAIDRFITFAMSTIALNPKRLKVVASGEMTENDFNVFFKPTDHPLRKLILDSVVKILAVDSEARKARAEARRSNAQRDAGEDSARWELLNELEGKI